MLQVQQKFDWHDAVVFLYCVGEPTVVLQTMQTEPVFLHYMVELTVVFHIM